MDIKYLDYLDDDIDYDWLEETIRGPLLYLRANIIFIILYLCKTPLKSR